jgi:zinc/manganese transport system substrate-binding protein
MKKLLFQWVVFIACILAAGCTESINVWQTDDKIRVVVSTTFIADFLRNIAGDQVEINILMREGSNHHAFEPTIRDAKIVGTSDIIFINGIDLEGDWLERLITSTDSEARVVVTAEGIERRPLVHTGHVHEGGDPHVWHSTENAAIIVTNITGGMVEFDPANRAVYEANRDAYQQQLLALEAEVRTIVSVIPEDRRKLVSSHEAFGYFADQFGLEVIGTVLIATQSQEPDRRQMQDIIGRIQEFQVPAVFTETSINPQMAEQIAMESGAKLIQNLYSDSLGLPGSPGDTYINAMLFNARAFASGLGE